MEKLEGGAPRAPARLALACLVSAPARPALAYLASAAEGVEGSADGENSVVRQGSADGDVVAATVTTNIMTLRRQLDEQAVDRENAKRQTAALRDELKAAKAESAALREQRGPAMPEDPGTAMRLVNDAFAELAKVRTESFKVRKELEKERSERRADLVRARAQHQTSQDELQRLMRARPPLDPVPHRPAPAFAPPDAEAKEARKAKLRGAAMVAGAVLAIGAVWPRVSRWSQERVDRPAVREPADFVAADTSRLPLTAAARTQFQSSVERLNRVLARKPGRSPEDLMREARERYKAVDPSLCAFNWRNGQPSLLYGGGHLSLGQTIQKCADAIEKSP